MFALLRFASDLVCFAFVCFAPWVSARLRALGAELADVRVVYVVVVDVDDDVVIVVVDVGVVGVAADAVVEHVGVCCGAVVAGRVGGVVAFGCACDVW